MTPTTRTSTWLRIVDAFLWLALFAVPALLGGRSGWGQLVLVIAASGAAIAWIAARVAGRVDGYRWTWAEPLLAGGVGLLVLQIVPLPASLIETLSPRISDWLPAWTSDGLGNWSTLSLYPSATARALISVSAMAVLFAVACQRIRTIADVERTLKAIAIAAALMATFGLVQYVAGNGRFFWFYEHPFTSTADRVKGAFTNKNHFAQFLALGAAPLAWWLLQTVGRRPVGSRRFGSMAQRVGTGDLRPALLMTGLGLVIFAGLLALSRGGALALGTAGLVCLGLLYRHRQVSGQLMAGLAATALLVGGCLAIYGFRDVSGRLQQWDPGVRLLLWDANLKTAEDFAWTGTGVGTHEEAYERYFDTPYHFVRYTHAENSPLQVASEAGLPGLGLALLAIIGCLAWCRRSVARGVDRRIAAAGAAVTAGLLAHLVHCGFDFLWYVPGCMVVVVLLAACARALAAEAAVATAPVASDAAAASAHPGYLLTRLGWCGGAVACLLATGLGLQECRQRVAGESHWNDYRRLFFAEANSSGADSSEAGSQLTVAQRRRQSRVEHRQRLVALGHTITGDGDHARAHLRLAAHYMALFEELHEGGVNPFMPLDQIRQAVFKNELHEDTAARNKWLDKEGVLGSNRKYLQKALAHARRAIALCPLQGMGYVHLAQLEFLEGAGPRAGESLLAQALAVRPWKARVHLAVGVEASLAGDQLKCLEHWKTAFGLDRSVQRQILGRLAAVGMPPAVIIKRFQPDWEALTVMKDLYRRLAVPSEYHVVLAGYARAAEERAGDQDGTDAVTSWLQAAGAYKQLSRPAETEACYERAIEENPASLTARLAYGRWLFSQQHFAKAAEHLSWCARQRPDDEKLRRLVRACRKATVVGRKQ